MDALDQIDSTVDMSTRTGLIVMQHTTRGLRSLWEFPRGREDNVAWSSVGRGGNQSVA